MQDIEIGNVVKSVSGRDKDQVFVVYKLLEKGYTLLIDGESKCVDKPKKKNVKHLAKIDTNNEKFCFTEQNMRDLDVKIKKFLKNFKN